MRHARSSRVPHFIVEGVEQTAQRDIGVEHAGPQWQALPVRKAMAAADKGRQIDCVSCA